MSFLLTPGVLQQQANRAGGKQYALEFDGVNDYVEFPEVLEFDKINIWLTLQDVNNIQYFLGGYSSNQSQSSQGIRYNRETLLIIDYLGENDSIIYNHPQTEFSKLTFKYNRGWEIYDNDVYIGIINVDSDLRHKFLGRRTSGLYFKGKVSVLQYLKDSVLLRDYDFSNPDPDRLYDKVNGNHGSIYGAKWVEL